MYDPSFDVYRQYVSGGIRCEMDANIQAIRDDILSDMEESPDYHCDTMRNGIRQPMMLTRGGEKHTYNVICRPGDELFAGDIIDAFQHKWIVIEARADSTTHKTGIMHQCNKLFRFQNFSSAIIERWGRIDISGYSSSFNSDAQMQHSSEQVAIYLPYDDDTAKIYVDKRLPSHIGYDSFGEKMLFSFKITGTNPVSESYNDGDHLLVLKAERFLYAHDQDNLDLEICDYISSDGAPEESIDSTIGLSCAIIGGKTIRIGSTRTYKASITDVCGEAVDLSDISWSIRGSGASMIEVDGGIKVSIADDKSLIGEDIVISAFSQSGKFAACEISVEVTGIV